MQLYSKPKHDFLLFVEYLNPRGKRHDGTPILFCKSVLPPFSVTILSNYLSFVSCQKRFGTAVGGASEVCLKSATVVRGNSICCCQPKHQ